MTLQRLRRLVGYLPLILLLTYGGFMLKGRAGMHATDPASVAIGQGQPQFVKFFGFW